MRTCLDGCTRLHAEDVSAADLDSQFVVLSGYCMYGGTFTAEVVARAHQVCTALSSGGLASSAFSNPC